MKKEILTCDMCGGIIAGPGETRKTMGKIGAAVTKGGVTLETFHSIDVCEDDAPWDIFEGSLTLLFDGRVHEGEIIELRERDVVLVFEQQPAKMITETHTLEQLSNEQRRYVEQAEDAIRQAWRQELQNNPHYEQRRN